MKTKVTVLLAIVIALNTTASTAPKIQPSSKVFSVSSFGNINVHRQHNSAALSWIFDSNDASGFVIQRSYDGTYFTTIDTKAPGSGHWNKYLDTTVEPGTIYYKLIAVMNDGSKQESPVVSVRIVRH